MTATELQSDTRALLDRKINDMLLHMRGLAVVRDLLTERGATDAEISAHSRELESVRHRLAELIGGADGGLTSS
jgi:hypothetical protein